MVEHDGQVGQLLKKLDDLGIADNTIVIYTTDNGAETFSWPDGGTTPFRGEKNTNWEGSYRVPAVVRWPGLVQPRTELNDIFSAEDWVPTLVAAAGDPDIKAKLLQGYDAGGKSFKVHLDGYDQRDMLAAKGPDKRREFFYWTDDGNLAGLRFDQYKWCSWNSRRTAWRFGCSLWFRCARLRFLIFVPIRWSAPNTRRAGTTDGSLSTPLCSFRLRQSLGSIWRPSKSFRRARSPAASPSTKPCEAHGADQCN